MVKFIDNKTIKQQWKIENRVPYLNYCDAIFHYTSPEAYSAIIKNETLRFTNAKCLNDTAEIKDGLDEICRYMENLPSSKDNDVLKNEILPEINRKYDFFGKTLDDEQKYTFLFSCSMDYDSLAMWQYYSKNKQMNGLVIGFDYSKLVHSILLLNHDVLIGSTISYGNAIYEGSQKQQVIADYLELLKYETGILIGNGIKYIGEHYAKTKKKNDDNFIKQFKNHIKDLSVQIENPPSPQQALQIYKYFESEDSSKQCFIKGIGVDAIPFSKNRSFLYEQEIRIAITFNEAQYLSLIAKNIIKKELRNDMEILYVDLIFSLDSITIFYSAPNINKNILQQAIETKNLKSSTKKISIIPSESTVRF